MELLPFRVVMLPCFLKSYFLCFYIGICAYGAKLLAGSIFSFILLVEVFVKA
jgi:hypothetical protein